MIGHSGGGSRGVGEPITTRTDTGAIAIHNNSGVGSWLRSVFDPRYQIEQSNYQAQIANERAENNAKILRDWQSSEADKDRQWQEYMSNTAYQRAVKDMKLAGINPVLAYSQGGASTGSGHSLSGSTASTYMPNTSMSGQAASNSLQGIMAIVAGLLKILK